MSLNSLIEMSRRSFRTLDAAMNVTGENVANLETEGYKRRRVTFQADSPNSGGIWSRLGPGTIAGGGVSIQDYSRMRDFLMMQSAWDAYAGLGSAGEEQRILGAMEGLFPTDAGSLFDQLDNFWSGWSELADNPTEMGVRNALASDAASLAGTLNRLDGDLQRLQEETGRVLTDGVGQMNAYLEEIAALNVAIQQAENAGSPDYASADRRDVLVTELSAFAPVRVSESASGYAVSIDGISVVDGAVVMPLTIDNSGAVPRLFFGDSTTLEFKPLAAEGGQLSAWLDAIQNTIPEKRSQLDDLASALVTEVNALHTSGYGLDGGTGRDFFDPAGVTASSIRVADAIEADPAAIAASGFADADGDSTIALGIADLRTQGLLDGGSTTMDNFVINLVSSIGAGVEAANNRAATQSAVVANLEALERGVSGVSLDEEMTRLIELQQSYAATTRVLTAAQEMMDILLNI